MDYVIPTESYNERRYGKPWAAFVTTSLSKDFAWIEWTGRPGYAGEFRFDAEPGAMIARGQKDNRKGRGGVDRYVVLMPNGGWVNTQEVGESEAGLLRMEPEQRWRAVADERLAYWTCRLAKDSNAAARTARYAAMLGVADPAMQHAAKALGLVEEKAPAIVTVSMDAFGL
jgi:hypothetical protein